MEFRRVRFRSQWRETATCMAPHAKYVAIYDAPFWREQGLSGEVRSARGPMGEIHDASMPGGSAALFGFLGVPARTRSEEHTSELQSLMRISYAVFCLKKKNKIDTHTT